MADMQDHVDADIVYVQPNYRVPKTLGILNLVFGGLLILWGACSGIMTLGQSYFVDLAKAQQKRVEADVDAKRQRDLDALTELEQAAESDEERQQLKQQREQIEQQPKFEMPNFTEIGMDPRMQLFTWTALLTGVLVNIVMVVAGVGLLTLKAWGRALSLVIAAVKIARQVVVQTWMMIVIVPITIAQMKQGFEQMDVQLNQSGGPPAAMFGWMTELMPAYMMAQSIITLVIACIYPVIVLILLTRPAVKLAFVQAAAQADEP